MNITANNIRPLGCTETAKEISLMTSWTLRLIPLALLTILVPALLIACEDSGGLSRSDIQQIVQSELANNPRPGRSS